jgi:hypothetical protein
MRILLFAIVVCCVVLRSGELCRAIDYYFSGAGSDTLGNGTLGSPWQSIAKLNTLDLNAGDNVYFRAGDTFTGNILLDASDSANNAVGVFGGLPLSLGSYGSGNRPVISSPTGHGLRATNAGGVEIRGLEIAGVTATSALTSLSNTTKGLFFENTVSDFRQQHVVIDNVVVHGFGQDGISFYAFNPRQNSGGFADVSIANSEVYSNGRSGIVTSASSSNGLVVGGTLYDFQSRAHGNFHVANNVVRDTTGKSESEGVSGNGIVLAQIDGAVIERNVAHHNGGVAGGGGVGIWTWEGNDVTIQFNEAYANDSFDGRDGGGFDLDGGLTNSVMQYNYSHGNHGAGLGLFEFGYASAMGRNAIRYNISEADGGGISVWGCGPHCDGRADKVDDSIFHNNTIINPTGPAAYFFGSFDDVGVYNNIFVQSGGRELARQDNFGAGFVNDVQLLHNAYWPSGGVFKIVWNGVTYSSLSGWADATGQEKVAGALVGLQIDPQLVGPFSGGITLDDPALLTTLDEYRLLATSALIDAGVDLATLPLPIALGLTDPGDHDYFGGLIPVRVVDIGAHEMPINGDFNADRNVDAADYVVWRKTDGTQAGYNLWRTHFGQTVGSGGGANGTAAIPEPATLIMLSLGATVSRFRRGRSAQKSQQLI